MSDFNQKEYQTVILAALLHVAKSRFVGDAGKGTGLGWGGMRFMMEGDKYNG